MQHQQTAYDIPYLALPCLTLYAERYVLYLCMYAALYRGQRIVTHSHSAPVSDGEQPFILSHCGTVHLVPVLVNGTTAITRGVEARNGIYISKCWMSRMRY